MIGDERRNGILVVEDEAIVALDLKAELESRGYAVVGPADTGDKALALARNDRPDLALVDVKLKGAMDGVELAQALKRELDLPVIYLTSYSDAATVQRAAQTTPYGYLTKPFQAKELQAAIDIALYKSSDLKAYNARRRVFFAQLAHELRNSMAPIKAGATVFGRARTVAPDAIEKIGAIMSRQVDHMSRLVDDVFDLAAVEDGVLSVTPQRVDLRQIIEQALAINAPILDQAQHSVAIGGVEFALPVDADPTRLIQVFSNLLNNAAKYTPPHGRISVTAAIEGSTVRVSVRDNGIGMPAGSATSVFETYVQLPASTELRRGGLGIGLALVRQIVEAHGGTVTATSAGLGMGSTFTVCLPIAADRWGPLPAKVTASRP